MTLISTNCTFDVSLLSDSQIIKNNVEAIAYVNTKVQKTDLICILCQLNFGTYQGVHTANYSIELHFYLISHHIIGIIMEKFHGCLKKVRKYVLQQCCF